ncbi:MAG: DNA methylase [Gammaproteobacteria bacterium]|nr:DNA methylase [Gammaproteobacteria bacterium]
MRHRFHSICPYFAMFPETFVEKHLAATPHNGIVFDPYCGRGTTLFQALLRGRIAAGSDVNPVAVCISGAKCDPPSLSAAKVRIDELRRDCREPDDDGWKGNLDQFFTLCFHRNTLLQVRYLRSVLDWRNRSDDRFIAALCLGALHGESHKSPNCFSNRMPRTISTKPDYSVQWWVERKYAPPPRDVFEILDGMLEYRFRSTPPDGRAVVVQTDARRVADAFPALAGRVTDVITSPPYLDTTNYREDQWLRLWFLGGEPLMPRGRGDDRHYNTDNYWTFIRQSMEGLAPLLAERARLVIRIGGRRLQKVELRTGLLQSLTLGLGRDVQLVDDGVTTEVGKTQANVFRGAKVSRFEEHDFCFAV